jgi:hypothetical protein
MAAALKSIRKNPDAEYPGWNWYPTTGHFIIRSFREGLDHRITMRGELARAALSSCPAPASLYAFHRSATA